MRGVLLRNPCETCPTHIFGGNARDGNRTHRTMSRVPHADFERHFARPHGQLFVVYIGFRPKSPYVYTLATRCRRRDHNRTYRIRDTVGLSIIFGIGGIAGRLKRGALTTDHQVSEFKSMIGNCLRGDLKASRYVVGLKKFP